MKTSSKILLLAGIVLLIFAGLLAFVPNLNSAVASYYIVPHPPGGTVTVIASPSQTGISNQEQFVLTYSGTWSGSPIKFAINYGDGSSDTQSISTSSTSLSVTFLHAYLSSGTYSISVTVNDPNDFLAQSIAAIVVGQSTTCLGLCTVVSITTLSSTTLTTTNGQGKSTTTTIQGPTTLTQTATVVQSTSVIGSSTLTTTNREGSSITITGPTTVTTTVSTTVTKGGQVNSFLATYLGLISAIIGLFLIVGAVIVEMND